MAVAVYGILHAGLPVERLVVEPPLFVALIAAVAFGQHVVVFLLPSASIVQGTPEVDVVAPQELVADGGFVLRPPTGFAAGVVVVAHVHQHAHQLGTVAECRVEYDNGSAYPRRILREPAVALKASAGVMAVVDAQLVAKPEGLLQCKSVAATHLEITITLVADVTRELVAIGQEVLGGRARLLVLTYTADFEVHVLGPALVLVVDREAHAALLHVGYTLALCFCSAPFTLAAWAVEFVDVVSVEEDVEVGMISVALAERLAGIRSPTQKPTPSPSRGEGSLITIANRNATSLAHQALLPSGGAGGGFPVGAYSPLHVGQIAFAIFALQDDVHHVVLRCIGHAQPLALLRLLLVDLDVLHRVVRQVVEHHLALSTEEVVAVECQEVHLAPLHIDLAIVAQFHAWHLTDEGIEHRAFRHVEGIGIVDQRVAAIDHLHLCGLDHHLAQIAAIELQRALLHERVGQVEEVIARSIAQGVVDGGGLVVGMYGHEAVTALGDGHLEAINGIVSVVVGSPGGHGVEHHTVFVLHVDLRSQHAVLRERVAHVAPQGNGAVAFRPVFHDDVAIPYLHLHGLSLADELHGLGHGLHLLLQRHLQVLDVVVNEGDVVVAGVAAQCVESLGQ